MSTTILFGDILEAIDTLSLDEQEGLITIVQRRLAERTRQQLLTDIQAARVEFSQGLCQQTSVNALMDDILS
jgi:hypothetical protein